MNNFVIFDFEIILLYLALKKKTFVFTKYNNHVFL